MKRSQAKRKKTGCEAGWKYCLLLGLIGFLLCGCEIWNLEKGIRQVGGGIREADGLGMEDAALYHLNVARDLLEAAGKQYEEADFVAASRFLDHSEAQLVTARTIHTLNRPVPSLHPGHEE